MDILTLKILIYWGSWLVFPLLAWFSYGYWRRKRSRFELAVVLVLGLLFIWARFVEPNLIIVRTTDIPAAGLEKRIAVISDLHLGVYKGDSFLQRVVERINELKPDLVLFAGDFSYHPGDITKLFAPFERLNAPIYAVLGNHDVERPGPPVRDELARVLPNYGVRLLQSEIVHFADFTLVGLGDHWAGEDDVGLLKQVALDKTVILLTHNPDTTSKYRDHKADFTICGHTHGGQIRIPWLYRKVIPTSGAFDRGLTKEPYTRLFISSGLGEIGLPLRFLNPPVIDLLRFGAAEK